MTHKQTADKARQALMATIKAAADHRRANPIIWSPDGYLIRPAGIAARLS